MRRLSGLLVIFLLVMTAACGSGYNNPPTNVGLFGNWNVAMYPTGSTTPVYVFAVAISQEGGSNYSGASTTYTGSVAIPTNMCINGNSLSLTATTANSGTTFTMTITDTTSSTIINTNGSVPTTTTSTISGSYNNAASSTCPASSGTMTMVAQ
ncbi:MAG: hypothetical protein WBW69_13685 [Candidatus Korobacteraceae bacterium]